MYLKIQLLFLLLILVVQPVLLTKKTRQIQQEFLHQLYINLSQLIKFKPELWPGQMITTSISLI